MTKESLESSISTLNSFIQFFAILSTIGIVGGAICGFRQWQQNKRLSQIVNAESFARQAEIARLNIQASEANKKAALAIVNSANAESKVADANRGWEEAKAGTATALIDLEAQKERTAQAEKELLILKEKVKHRKLTDEQKISILPELKFMQKGYAQFVSTLGDAEAANYAKEIADLLIQAGWKINPEIGMSTIRGIGIFMFVKHADPPPPGAIALQQIFTKYGINLQGQELAGLEPDSIQIFVGTKPQ